MVKTRSEPVKNTHTRTHTKGAHYPAIVTPMTSLEWVASSKYRVSLQFCCRESATLCDAAVTPDAATFDHEVVGGNNNSDQCRRHSWDSQSRLGGYTVAVEELSRLFQRFPFSGPLATSTPNIK